MEHVSSANTLVPLKYKNTLDFSRVFAGSPKGNRTPVNAVREPPYNIKVRLGKVQRDSAKIGLIWLL